MNDDSAVPVAWLWKTVTRWTGDEAGQDSGTEPTEDKARQAAEKALQHPNAIAALVFPAGLHHRGWVALADPMTGLKTTLHDGSVMWYRPSGNDGKWFGRLRVVE